MKRKNIALIIAVLFLTVMVLPSFSQAATSATSVVFRKEFAKPEPSNPNPDPNPPSSGLTASEQEMFNLLNNERTSRGLRPLQLDMQLVRLARLKSQDMINKNYFSHYSPTYGMFNTMLSNNGVSFRASGENLAGASSVQQAHSSLMNSSGHKANILKSGYTHIGIGIAPGGPYGNMFTQLFITR